MLFSVFLLPYLVLIEHYVKQLTIFHQSYQIRGLIIKKRETHGIYNDSKEEYILPRPDLQINVELILFIYFQIINKNKCMTYHQNTKHLSDKCRRTYNNNSISCSVCLIDHHLTSVDELPTHPYIGIGTRQVLKHNRCITNHLGSSVCRSIREH